ncbi:MAG: phage baseplate assembly protein V [Nostocoides sp.]
MSPIEIGELNVRASAADPTRYHGLFAGMVTDNNDPEGKCRIRTQVPEVLADGDTGWCVPALPYTGDGAGFAAVPPVGTQVWVQWPGGDLSAPPIWSGGSYSAGGAVAGAGPNTVILLTPGGHRIELDDDGTALTITCSQGPVITLDSSGVSIDNGQGAKIVMQGPKVDVNDGALVVQ